MPKKAAKRSRREASSRLFDDAAEDSDTEISEERLQAMRKEEEEATRHIRAYQPKRTFFVEGEEEMTEEAIAKELKERYRAGVAAADEGEGSGSRPGSRFMHRLLPRPQDPKVFSIKCRPGMTRQLVAQIVNKCYHYRVGSNFEKRRVDLGIISVFAMDHVREHIFVESHRQVFVESALSGLTGLYRSNISIVDPAELMQLLERQARDEDLRPGTFVRLRQSPYQGDLARVVKFDEGTQRVFVKVVPRVDFVHKPPPSGRFVGVRHPPRFFDPTQAVDARVGDTVAWGPWTFDAEGYLLKSCSVRGVTPPSKMPPPTAEELKIFFKTTQRFQGEAPMALPPPTFRIGDMALATGQLSGVRGRVVNVAANGQLTLECATEHGTLSVDVGPGEAERYFPNGCHVMVETEGATGVVVHSDGGGKVQVVMDSDGRMIEATTRSCRLTNMTHGAIIKAPPCRGTRLFDLVRLSDGTTVGCIVTSTMQGFSIITTTGLPRNIAESQIREVMRERITLLDSVGNPVHSGDEVKIIAGEHIGHEALVKQLFDQSLFVVVKGYYRHSGVAVVKALHTSVLGGRTRRRPIKEVQQLPQMKRQPYHARNEGAANTAQEIPQPSAQSSQAWIDP